jgi:hypothetical protein
MKVFFIFLGDSKSTLAAQAAAEKCYNKYALERNLSTLRTSSRENFCTVQFHEEFAFWIVYNHKSSTTKEQLSNGTIQSYIGCILTIGRNQLFKGDPFFVGLDGESNNWYSGMRSKIERIFYLQCIEKEEKMAEQAPPISREDMKLILQAYFRQTTFNLYKWDRINNVTGYYWTQRKTSKSRGVYFVTDFDCVFLNHYYMMGLYLMSGQGQENYESNDNKNNWVFQDMHCLRESGGSRKMSGFLQDLEKSRHRNYTSPAS